MCVCVCAFWVGIGTISKGFHDFIHCCCFFFVLSLKREEEENYEYVAIVVEVNRRVNQNEIQLADRANDS